MQSGEPPDTEDGLGGELGGEFEARLLRRRLYQRGECARIPGFGEFELGAEVVHGGEDQRDPREDHDGGAGITEQHAEALGEGLACGGHADAGAGVD